MAKKKIVLRLENVGKRYVIGENGKNVVNALSGINLEVQEGESLAIMGPSGSGKSTMLHILGALDKPTSGEVYFDGTKVSSLSEDELAMLRSRKIGFVFQAFFLIPTQTVSENVMLPMILSGKGRDESEARARKLLARVGLGDRMGHMATELSGGQKQRVAIARALANNPSFILADEPTGNLDSTSGKGILSLFDELNGEGRTIITVTHDAGLVTHATRIVKLKDGKIVS